jgi:hypothetical protein
VTKTHSDTPPPSTVLAILDTFRRSPDAVSERAQETLEAFGLLDDETSQADDSLATTN